MPRGPRVPWPEPPVPGKTGRRIARFVQGLGEALAAAAGPAPAQSVEPQPGPPRPTLDDLERLNVARLRQAEQIFEFEVLAVEARASIDALRAVDLLLAALLAAQLVSGMLLLGMPDPSAVALFAVLGLAVGLVCWSLAVTSWAETAPLGGQFLTDLAADAAGARATAVVKAAGVVKRNERRRTLKLRLFALAVVLTVGDLGWVAATHVQQLATPIPAPTAAPSPSPSPSPAPTVAPTPQPTPRPARRTPHAEHRQHRPAQRPRTNNSR